MDIPGQCLMKVLYPQWIMHTHRQGKGMFNGSILFPAPLRCPHTMRHRSPAERRPLLPAWPQRPLRSLHLRQGRFRLREPEGHVHVTVERDGSRERGTGLLLLVGLEIQRAEATMAVGLQGTHAEFLG